MASVAQDPPLPKVGERHVEGGSNKAYLIALVLGALVFIIPTLVFVARESWTGEQGAHGPIVLATGLWLLVRLWPRATALARRPALVPVVLLMAVLLPAYYVSRVTEIVEVQGYIAYAVLLVALYSLIGGAAMRQLWFPLFYLAFIFPPPETLIWAITMPMKIGISQAAIALLSWVGYPVGGEGVVIFIGQYELLVAAACSGLNSIISLSAITLFYIYLRHEADWQYALLLTLFIVPIALLANFLRVIILILLTYHAGEATAQGFLHNSAGLLMFAIALLSMMALDAVLQPIWQRMRTRR